MGIREDELNRLMRYANGMGISVRFKSYTRNGNEAEWSLDGTEIVIYVQKKSSKIDKILSLIHELGHAKGFVDNNRTIDPKLEAAIDSEENKKHRKIVMDMEIADSVYWEDIYRDTNCQFNIDKLHKQKEFDIFQYRLFYETGKYPTHKEKRAKRKELRKKYGC